MEKKSNMLESTSGYPRGQDTEEVLINFSEEELDYVNAGTVEIQRVVTFLAMKQRDTGEELRPILA